MLVSLSPLPEEMDRGYLGRVMRINGYRKLKSFLDALGDIYQDKENTGGRSWHGLLCSLAEMKSEDFSQRHTTLPLRRGITSYFPEVAHGSADRPMITAKHTVQRKYPAAFFCEQCAQADIVFHGMSYWRREHQTPGQLWCSKHSVPLSFTVEPDAMQNSPAQSVAQAHPIPLEIVQDARGNAFVQRYLELVSAMYERNSPLAVGRIVPVLRDRAKLKGFHAYAGPVRTPLISDHICAVFPAKWLERVFPSLMQKSRGVALPQIDGALFMRKSSSSTVAYLLVLAVLFDSADEAIKSLQDAHDGVVVPPVLLRHGKYVLPADDELIDAYINAFGQTSKIPQDWELPKPRIQKRLLELGLPNLDAQTEKLASLRAGMQAFYVDGLSYAESLKISGMTSRRFDALLRVSGPNFCRALRKMDQKNNRCSRKELAHSLQRLLAVEQVQAMSSEKHEEHQL